LYLNEKDIMAQKNVTLSLDEKTHKDYRYPMDIHKRKNKKGKK